MISHVFIHDKNDKMPVELTVKITYMSIGGDHRPCQTKSLETRVGSGSFYYGKWNGPQYYFFFQVTTQHLSDLDVQSLQHYFSGKNCVMCLCLLQTWSIFDWQGGLSQSGPSLYCTAWKRSEGRKPLFLFVNQDAQAKSKKKKKRLDQTGVKLLGVAPRPKLWKPSRRGNCNICSSREAIT